VAPPSQGRRAGGQTEYEKKKKGKVCVSGRRGGRKSRGTKGVELNSLKTGATIRRKPWKKCGTRGKKYCRGVTFPTARRQTNFRAAPARRRLRQWTQGFRTFFVGGNKAVSIEQKKGGGSWKTARKGTESVSPPVEGLLNRGEKTNS